MKHGQFLVIQRQNEKEAQAFYPQSSLSLSRLTIRNSMIYWKHAMSLRQRMRNSRTEVRFTLCWKENAHLCHSRIMKSRVFEKLYGAASMRTVFRIACSQGSFLWAKSTPARPWRNTGTGNEYTELRIMLITIPRLYPRNQIMPLNITQNYSQAKPFKSYKDSQAQAKTSWRFPYSLPSWKKHRESWTWPNYKTCTMKSAPFTTFSDYIWQLIREMITMIRRGCYLLTPMMKCEGFNAIEFLERTTHTTPTTQRFLDAEQWKILEMLLLWKQELQWEMLWTECAKLCSKCCTLLWISMRELSQLKHPIQSRACLASSHNHKILAHIQHLTILSSTRHSLLFSGHSLIMIRILRSRRFSKLAANLYSNLSN